MNRPYCLIGSIDKAKEYIKENYPDANYEFLTLNNEIGVEDLKNFRIFLEEASINIKVGIIYAFNSLTNSKQSILLKIFEDLPKNVRVVFHSFYSVDFTIHTRCNIIYLKQDTLQKDLIWLNNLFLEAIKSRTLTKEMKQGIEVFFSTLNFYNINLLSEDEKDYILESLK